MSYQNVGSCQPSNEPFICSFIAQLLRGSHRHREVSGSSPVEVLKFSGLFAQLRSQLCGSYLPSMSYPQLKRCDSIYILFRPMLLFCYVIAIFAVYSPRTFGDRLRVKKRQISVESTKSFESWLLWSIIIIITANCLDIVIKNRW